MLGGMLLTWHNLHYYQQLMQGLRTAIEDGVLEAFVSKFQDMQSLGDIASL